MDIQRINQYKNTFDYHFRELTKKVEYNIPEDMEEWEEVIYLLLAIGFLCTATIIRSVIKHKFQMDEFTASQKLVMDAACLLRERT